MKTMHKGRPKTRTRNSRGRKKFGASKQIGPDKTVEENLSIAALGEFASGSLRREIFNLVALWKTRHSSAFNNYQDTGGALLNRQQRRELLTRRLLEIIVPALDKFDAETFRLFVDAMRLAQSLDTNGALLKDTHEVLRVVEALNLKLGDKEMQEISPQEFRAQVRWPIGERQFARIKKQIGLHFPAGRPKA